MQTVAATQEHVQGIQNYLENPLTSQQDRLTAVKVLGNAGSTQSQGLLLKIIKDRSESSQIRVNSIWALRRIISQAKDKIYPSLISTFSDTNESPELRMAIFQLLLNSEPNVTTLQSVTNIVRQEITNQDPGPRSNQVASYVISLLSSVASNDNPVMKKRAMQARGALQLLPKKMFGPISYSKGVRLHYYTEKLQAGTEIEVNKMNVPESSIPRNMNARLMLNLFGYKTDAIEFGTRIENMDDTILEHLTPNVQRRKKRSLLGSALSWFTEGSSAGKAKQGSVSTYIRVFGDELKFAEISPGQLDQLADDVTDLSSGRKSRLELKDQGIVISKDKVTIEQALEKAILLNDARRMLPTLTGIPLDIQFTSSAVIKLIGAAKMNIGSSLWGLLPDISKITGDVEIKPSVHAHADVSVGIHTPYLRMGLQLSGSASASPVHKLYFLNDAGTSRVRYDIPNERRDIVNVK
ncbi:vitellogenin-2-like [Porites lutea]|uniref:vitellogenin-2-like n=1 Tax=Porites lutea TaxID=51062 RepID=UPI003CC65075